MSFLRYNTVRDSAAAMAEKGAHLTQTLQLKPSIFDFYSEEALDSQLWASFKKVSQVFLKNSRFPFLYDWFTEIFYLSHFLFQMHYLKRFAATFSEHFYGLKRVPATTEGGRDLTRKHLLLSLFFTSILPYLRQKLRDKADKIYFDELPYEREEKKILLQKTILGINKWSNVILNSAYFAQTLRYMSGKTDIQTPYLWGCKLKLEYSEELSQNDLSLRNFIPQLLRRSLELSAFFLQFCQWWQTERTGVSNILQKPPPPVPCSTERSGMCPLCKKMRVKSTALLPSGYVFCFHCISDHVTKFKKCPITNLPANLNNLIILYSYN